MNIMDFFKHIHMLENMLRNGSVPGNDIPINEHVFDEEMAFSEFIDDMIAQNNDVDENDINEGNLESNQILLQSHVIKTTLSWMQIIKGPKEWKILSLHYLDHIHLQQRKIHLLQNL